MDFRRSAIVLIVCFFFLDVFLFGLVWQKKVESKTPLNTSINVIDQMKQDGITLPSLTSTDETAPIIQLTPVSIESSLNNLQNQIVSLEKNVINAELVPPIQLSLSNPVNAESFNDLTAFINNKVLFGDKYVWSSYNATTRKVIYTQKADKLSIMDGTSQIIVTLNTNDQAVSYEQTYAGNVQVLGNERSLITAQSAVEVLFLAGKIPAKSTVSTVKLSYFQSLVLKEFSIYSPAWYVEIRQADGQLVARRVDAIHGTVLTNETLETTNTQTQRTTTNNTTTQTVQQQ
nr:two-component system regulatory protein YycI [uncultured Granulicatella sp.]